LARVTRALNAGALPDFSGRDLWRGLLLRTGAAGAQFFNVPNFWSPAPSRRPRSKDRLGASAFPLLQTVAPPPRLCGLNAAARTRDRTGCARRSKPSRPPQNHGGDVQWVDPLAP
jgi:hypothetical protein